MRDPQLPPLRYLSAADVRAAMPPLQERLELAERTMTALVADAELPPKIGVHPRPAGSFAHAMPAWLRGAAEDGTADRLGIKWVSGFGPANAARGLPAIHAVVILGDALTGVPVAILDGGPITAERTAAVSGVAIGRFAPVVTGRPVRAALIGAGVQGRSHLPVLGYLLPGVEVAIHDRHPERAEALADVARATAGVGTARVVATPLEATREADVVVTAASFTTADRRGSLGEEAFAPHALVVAVDYATLVGCRGGPLRAPVPDRRPGPVPGEPRRRPVRGLSGPVGDARRGDPRRDGAPERWPGGREPPRGGPRRRDLRRRDRAARRGPRPRDHPAPVSRRSVRLAGRAIGVILVVVVVVALVGAGLLTWITVRALPQTTGTVSIPGLSAPVTVVRDRNGIAHITADTPHDLFLAQGYVHAQERMWQMEVWRHISAGRLSEIFGKSQLDTDRFIRTLGWWEAAAARSRLVQSGDGRDPRRVHGRRERLAGHRTAVRWASRTSRPA